MTHITTRLRATVTALLFALLLLLPQPALAAASPWGPGSTFAASTGTLTITSGTHAISSFNKTINGRIHFIRRLIIHGGTTKITGSTGSVDALSITGGRISAPAGLSVYGSMRMSGGVVSISSKRHYGDALAVSGDLVVKGGKLSVSTLKEGCGAIRVMGDMAVQKGTIIATTKGKSADALSVSGFLRMRGGTLRTATAGKYSVGIIVMGDYLQAGGTVKSTTQRAESIRCFDQLKVAGGKISSLAKGGAAISSGEVAVIRLGCLGQVRGRLPQGACFSVGGVAYRVTSEYDATCTVIRGSTRAKTVVFGAYRYVVR